MLRSIHEVTSSPSIPLRAALVLACCAAPTTVAAARDTSSALPAPPAANVPPPALVAASDTTPDAGMLRYPDISASQIAFVYADDIWVVSRDGGQAAPLASPAGPELFPRFSPDGKTLAFVGNYDGNRDLYTLEVGGGLAKRITHHPMPEQLCDWTPDGSSLIFASGHAAPLGGRQSQLFTVAAGGGLPVRLPVPYGGNGALSADGQWLAYVPVPFDFRTWKRYEGGTAMDVWLFDLQNHVSRRMTDWAGTDTQPMWHGKTVYYLSDAGSNHVLNLWSFDTLSGARSQSTDLGDFDVRWPAIGPGPDGSGEIVFQHGSALKVFDCKTRNVRTVPVTIPGDRPTLRPRTVDVAEAASSWSLSPSGKRALCEARCDIWTLGAENGSPRNLTATDGVSERYPAWSPDGEWVAYSSDADGEYELWMRASDGKGAPRQLTDGHAAFFSDVQWSPDSARLSFSDQLGTLYVHDVKAGTTSTVDKDPFAATPEVSWSHDGSWLAYTKTGDNQLTSLWLHDTQAGSTAQLTAGRFRDTSPAFDREGKYLFFASARDISQPIYEDLGTTFVYAATQRLLLVPLRADVPSPWLPESDEELYGAAKEKAAAEHEGKGHADSKHDKADDDDAADEDGRGGDHEDGDDDDAHDDDHDDTPAADGKSAADKPKERLKIDVEGFERRAILLPVERGSFGGLQVDHEGKLIFARGAAPGSDEPPSIRLFDPAAKDAEGQKEEVLAEKADEFALSADGEKLLVVTDGEVSIRNAAPGAKAKPVSTAGMTVTVDPRAEWREIYVDAWRRYRDWFYDPNMHGVNWPQMRTRYEALLAECVSREDVSYVIRELISELNVGHAYYNTGESEDQPEMSVGLLGVDFALEQGAYRIATIFEGAPWDVDARGPLSQPGVAVKAGDWLLAVDGVPLDTTRDPWAAFQDKAGRVVTLTVSDKPTLEAATTVAAASAVTQPAVTQPAVTQPGVTQPAGSQPAAPTATATATATGQRDVIVEPIASESDLRYRAWIEHNRALVAEKSGGRVGYVHVPDTGVNGQDNLFRQFFGQIAMPALIVDERWNGGGQIPTRFIELLNRPPTNMWAVRGSKSIVWPPDSRQGPQCMLINQRAGSGGDAFPYYFRQAKLGPLIGVRTWGGLVGIGDLPDFLDGASVSVPNFAFYENDGTWGVEGHGVDPDIEVIDDPALMVTGGDPQLDKAIEVMVDALRDRPFVAPPVPAFPDRSGMGLKAEDR